MDRVCRKEDGKNGSFDFEWTKNGKQKRQLLLRRYMESQVFVQIQMASSYWTTRSWGETEERETKSWVVDGAQSGWILLVETCEIKADWENNVVKDKER